MVEFEAQQCHSQHAQDKWGVEMRSAEPSSCVAVMPLQACQVGIVCSGTDVKRSENAVRLCNHMACCVYNSSQRASYHQVKRAPCAGGGA